MSHPEAPKTPHHTRSPWGIGAIIMGLLAFVGAQIAVGLLFSVVGGDDLSTSTQFYMYGSATLVTLVLLQQILQRFHASFKDLGLTTFRAKYVGYALSAFLIYFIISGLLSGAVAYFFPELNLDQKQELGFNEPHSIVAALMVLVSLVIIPPIVEELLFRGLIFKGIKRYASPVVAAVITSLLFGVAHGQWNVALDTFALSLVLCYLVEKTDSLWPAIILHGTKNLLAFLLLFVVQK